MQVVAVRKRRNEQLVAVAKELLELAEAGDLHGMAFVIKLGLRDHRPGLAGDYQGHPEEALYATLKMKKSLLDEEN